MTKIIRLKPQKDLEKVTLYLGKGILEAVDKYYPFLKNTGLAENKTQALTYLASIGAQILDSKLSEKRNIYVGKNPRQISSLELYDKYGNLIE